MLDNHDLLTVSEVMEILRLSKSKVYQLLHGKQLKGIRIGRKWVIPKRSIQELLEPKPAVAVVPTLAGLRQMVGGKG